MTVSQPVVRFLRATNARWVEVNPVLASGQPGWETDTRVLRVGDGVTRFTDLVGFPMGTGFQPLDADLTAIANLATTPFGRDLLTKVDAAATRTALGLGSAALSDAATFEPAGAVAAAIAALVASSPATLDTLNEIAAALGNDPNFATTILNALAGKQPLDANLTALAAVAATAFGRDFLALADAQTARAKIDAENIPAIPAASTNNINIAAMASATIDGYTLQVGEFFLAKNQTNAAENGIRQFNGVGQPAPRAPGWTTIRQIAGAQVRILYGNNAGGVTYTARIKASDILDTTVYSWGNNYGSGGPLVSASNGGTGTNSVPTAGQTLVGRSTSVYRAQPGYPVAWTASTAYSNYQPVILPTGGIGYSTTDRTSGAAWDATERAAWTFVPGGHVEIASTWTCPTGITLLQDLDMTAGGGGGGGGGSTASALNQVGGGGGAAGERTVYRAITVTPGTTYTGSVGAGGTGGAGGASGGAPGSAGTNGGNTSVTIGGVTYQVSGGGKGAGALASSTAQVVGGTYGADWGNSTTIPGSGGYAATNTGGPAIPGPNVVGGAGGAPSNSTNGGQAGSVRLATSPNGTRFSGSNGGSATAAGGDAANATEPGCGGAGGGGGAVGGKGGNGSNGASGRIIWRF